ncbi:DNA polymerase III, subunit gamma/tau [Candidatus Omnitrophus magneticus]|uniref:DNA polymerase III subunit gamma/tau n=1 Tax=Candidatus Omnitrophus magneticus TaxID=1609969 RepID=A0A0F0CU47_9BACT|nr:DNA polymerase III, subunit gamma/tau [Candidatus Omnitrophus magneticus]
MGKTSIARLVAKMLNCLNASPDGPCNKCSSCEEITRGSSIDVLEIDGASNRGIDEIRALRESVKFMPSSGKYKIYIIDEVHMLTTEAFNALLKTLEEPPSHVKFIFATTEAYKVLPTILSRCQRFDFKRIGPMMIFDRLKYIANLEKIDIEDKACVLIARGAEGSLRDALVVMDQMISFSSGEKIKSEDVIELLGMIHNEKLFELSNRVILGETKEIIEILDLMINNGNDPVFITESLLEHYRNLMIIKTTGSSTSDMAFVEEEISVIKSQSAKLTLEEILYILQNLSQALTLMKSTMFTRAIIEICLLRLAKRNEILSLPEVLESLEKIDMSKLAVSAPEGQSLEKHVITHIGDGLKGGGVNQPVSSNNVISHGGSGSFTWDNVLHYIKSKSMSAYSAIIEAKVLEFTPERVTIIFKHDKVFIVEMLSSGSTKSIIEDAFKSVFGKVPKFEIKQDGAKENEKSSQKIIEKKQGKDEMHPVIEKAMDIFGGRIVRDTQETDK